MSLKNIKLSVPLFDEIIPSTGAKVKMRAYRVADEKTLLIAADSNSSKQMVDALKSIIGNCVQDIDVQTLTPYDIEYLFLKIRALSVGEISEVGIPCEQCGIHNEISVDLSTVTVKKFKDHTDLVKIESGLAFRMQSPAAEDMVELDLTQPGILIDIVVNSVKEVFTDEEQIEISFGDRDDLRTLVESMSTAQFEKLKVFFETMPRVRKEVDFTCGSCGFENKTMLEGLQSFF